MPPKKPKRRRRKAQPTQRQTQRQSVVVNINSDIAKRRRRAAAQRKPARSHTDLLTGFMTHQSNLLSNMFNPSNSDPFARSLEPKIDAIGMKVDNFIAQQRAVDNRPATVHQGDAVSVAGISKKTRFDVPPSPIFISPTLPKLGDEAYFQSYYDDKADDATAAAQRAADKITEEKRRQLAELEQEYAAEKDKNDMLQYVDEVNKNIDDGSVYEDNDLMREVEVRQPPVSPLAAAEPDSPPDGSGGGGGQTERQWSEQTEAELRRTKVKQLKDLITEARNKRIEVRTMQGVDSMGINRLFQEISEIQDKLKQRTPDLSDGTRTRGQLNTAEPAQAAPPNIREKGRLLNFE